MQKSHKRIIENIFSLGLLNGINMIIPLVTLPYLIRTIGLSNYGGYSIVYAMLQYGILISAYGFNFSTTQQIAQNRENKELINEIFVSTILSRFSIAVVACLVFLCICYFAYPPSYLLMFVLGIGIVIGDILNPVWLYQGMETMRLMTFINLICKGVFTCLIFLFIKDEADYKYVTLLNSIGYLSAGIVSMVVAINNFKIKTRIPAIPSVVYQFKQGWYIFLSTIFMNLYRNSNVFILGFFLHPTLVGIYSGAEKVIKAIQAVISPISNALFPYVARSFKTVGLRAKIKLIKKMAIIIGCPLVILSIATYFFAPYLDSLLLDGIGQPAILLVRIMIPVIFFGGLNYIIGLVGLVNMNEKKSFFNYVMISGVLSICVLLILVPNIGVNSAGYAMSLTEVLLFILCIHKLIRLKKSFCKINLKNE